MSFFIVVWCWNSLVSFETFFAQRKKFLWMQPCVFHNFFFVFQARKGWHETRLMSSRKVKSKMKIARPFTTIYHQCDITIVLLPSFWLCTFDSRHLLASNVSGEESICLLKTANSWGLQCQQFIFYIFARFRYWQLAVAIFKHIWRALHCIHLALSFAEAFVHVWKSKGLQEKLKMLLLYL